jgi:hypothetical protein
LGKYFPALFSRFFGRVGLKKLTPKIAESVLCGRGDLAALTKAGLLRFAISVA